MESRRSQDIDYVEADENPKPESKNEYVMPPTHMGGDISSSDPMEAASASGAGAGAELG